MIQQYGGTLNSISRKVIRILEPTSVLEGAGVKLKRSFPGPRLDFPDPFLLLDHFGSDNPPDYLPDFPMHPHRGIETVTYMLAGNVSHRDSIGNAGIIYAGDVQWMTSGSGIMHEEMPDSEEGTMEGFQLWVNLPAKLKMSAPRYQEYTAEQIPEFTAGDGVTVKVIAGEINGIRGPVSEITIDPTYIEVTLGGNREFRLNIEKGHTALTYIYRGECTVKDRDGEAVVIASPKLLLYDDGDFITLKSGQEGAKFLLFAGKPIGESIVRYGPFVMNTHSEIQQALSDLRNGTFVKQPG